MSCRTSLCGSMIAVIDSSINLDSNSSDFIDCKLEEKNYKKSPKILDPQNVCCNQVEKLVQKVQIEWQTV